MKASARPRAATQRSVASGDSYVRRIRQLRKNKQFHSYVERRLIDLCADLFPDLHPVKEIQGLAGGRNDLILFEFNARKVLIEVFGTASQVSRDLRILDRTHADVKIAVLIDKEVDPRVFEQFLILLTIRRLADIGLTTAALKKLVKWMSRQGAVEFMLRNVSLGFNVYLYSDLRKNFGFYNDAELLDFLRIGPEMREPSVLLSMNSVVLEILDKYYKGKFKVPRTPRIFVGQAEVFEGSSGRSVIVSIPSKTTRITVLPPLTLPGQKEPSAVEIARSIDVAGFDKRIQCQEAQVKATPPKRREKNARKVCQ